jgi:hypothetical protein
MGFAPFGKFRGSEGTQPLAFLRPGKQLSVVSDQRETVEYCDS